MGVVLLLPVALSAGCHQPPAPAAEPADPILPPFAGGSLPELSQVASAARVPGHENVDPTGAMAVIMGYRERLNKNPNDLEALVLLGNANYDIQRFAEAEPLYRRALAIESENAFVRTDLATTLYRLGRATEAVEELQRALAIDYKHESALYNLGMIKLNALNDRAGAISVWEQLIGVTQNQQLAADLKAKVAQLRGQPTQPPASGSTSGPTSGPTSRSTETGSGAKAADRSSVKSSQ